MLAPGFSTRPETGFGPVTSLAQGDLVVLVQPEEAGKHPLAGLGGTGKTQMAAGLAHALWQAGSIDLLAWIPASSRDAILTGYAQVLADIGMAGQQGDREAAAGRLLGWLAEASRPWLVVLDDLADLADLDGLWPRGSAGRTLITTRLPAEGLRAPDRRIHTVGSFSRREALAYLTARLYDDPGKRTEALDLAEDLSCLPLGLAIATALMADCDFDCRAYRLRFTDRRQHVTQTVPDAFSAALTSAWSLSLDRADQLPPAGLARPALALAALLCRDGIPGVVLTSPSARSYIAGADGPDNERAARGALDNLARVGLLTIDPSSTLRTVRIHDVVRQSVLQVIPQPVLEEAAAAAAAALLEAWPKQEFPPLLAQALRDATAGLHRAAARALWTSEGHEVLFRAGRSMEAAGLGGAAASYWEMLAAASADILGADHRQTMRCRDSVARSLEAAGRVDEAIKVHGQNLADRERLLGQGHPDTLTSRSGLAHALLRAGRLADAVPQYERTLAGREWVLGRDHPDTLAARSDLADAYRAAGRLGDAITVFQRTLADRELVLGKDHPDTLVARANLASAYHSAGQLKAAIPLYERTVADQERVLGPDHPDTMTSRASLAYAYRSANRMKDAIPVYRRTLEDRERVLGRDHPDTITSRANLAAAYHTARRVKEAIPLYEQTLADRERVQGMDHPATLTARGNLASAYHSAGRLASALPLYEQTLAEFERVLGPYHQDTLTSRANLASAYHASRRLTDAIAVYERALADAQRVLPPDHPLIQAIKENLATAASALSQLRTRAAAAVNTARSRTAWSATSNRS